MSRSADLFGYAGLALLVGAGLVRLLFAGSGTIALGILVLGIVLFLVYFFRSERSVQTFLSRRSTREGGSVLGVALFVVGIAFLVNLLAATFNWRFDITADRVFTLAPETRQALKEAPASPRVLVFFPPNSPQSEAMKLILESAIQVRSDLEYEILDPWQEPARAARFELKDYSTVVQIGDRFEQFFTPSEEEFTTALLRASRERRGKIGFLRGHGETLVNDPEPAGLRRAGEALERRGYVPYFVDLLSGGNLSDSLDAVVIAGSDAPLSPAETDSFQAYLDRGGRLLFLLDPESPQTFDELLARGGLRFRASFVHDPDQRNPLVHFPSFSNHPVVAALAQQRIQVVLAGAGEVEMEKPPADVRQYRLLWTRPRATLADDPGSEPRSRTLGAAAEWTSSVERNARLVVIGDSHFPLNQQYETLGNADLFLGAVQWLAQDVIASIRPRARTNRPVVISNQQGRALMVLVVGVLPVLVLSSGLGVWWRRR